MFFLNKSDLDKKFKILRAELQNLNISEELRGWNWQNPPIEPLSREILFGVGDLAARYCETLRDIYLKKVQNIKPLPNIKMFDGIVYHAIASDAIIKVKSLIFKKGIISGASIIEELLPKSNEAIENAIQKAIFSIGKPDEKDIDLTKRKAISFYKFLIIQAAAQINNYLSKFPHIDIDSLINQAIPPIVERKIDGSLIGLAKELSVDIYTPAYAIADLKTGEIRKFHKYAPTGYALAIEADEEIEANFGIIIYIKLSLEKEVPIIQTKCFIISDALRREFLEIRDEALEIVENARDPGKPSICPDYCPYYSICKNY